MPDLTRRSLALLPLLLSWPGPARADAFPLPALMSKLGAVPERRAPFREQRRFAALNAPLQSAGTLYYRRPDYLEKNTTWPEPERLVVDGGRFVLTEGNDAPRVINLNGQPELRTMIEGMRGPLAGDLAALERGFTVQAAGTLGAWTLDLIPRDPAAQRLLRSIRLAGQDDAIRDLWLEQANGDEQWMQIGAPA